jgi:2-phosphoglycerate kinase
MFKNIKPEQYRHVLWMGGSPCSGKSSMCDLLAEMYHVDIYHVDDAFFLHRDEFTPEQYPINYKWIHTPWESLWNQSHKVLFTETILAYKEHLQFVFLDLLSYDDLVIAEGTSLLPQYIAPLMLDEFAALWVVPTENFQREIYPKRGTFVDHILQQCTDPERALQNWMDRDVAFASWIIDQTKSLGFCHILVDGHKSIEENAQTAAMYYHLDQRKR